MSAGKKTIACFGATGGTVGVALAAALNTGHHCTALARNPEKLRSFLSNLHNVPLRTIEQYLTICQGDAKDPTAVAKALVNPTNKDVLVDVILSGVGAYPTFQWSVRQPLPLTDPTICETALKALFAALSALSPTLRPQAEGDTSPGKPLLVVVSTSGCGRRRAIPLSIYLPYHYLLSSPLADKKRMETLVLEDKGVHLKDFVIMRPPVLTDGEARGDAGLRIGWEWGTERGPNGPEEPGPEVGYFVSRKDVGTWIFEKAIVQGGWEGKCVYLTY